MTRGKYLVELKREAVLMVRDSDITTSQIPGDLGIIGSVLP